MSAALAQPLVSICVPTYNGGRYLEEALRSAFAQTYPHLEIVVSDDRSTDDTLAVIERLRPEAPMPITVHHHEPAGIGANWNNCVRKANGTYIKFLFQDDLLAPDCVQRMVDLALTDERIGLVYCKRRILFDRTNAQDVEWVRRYGALHRSWKDLRVEEGVLDGKAYLGDAYLMEQPFNKIGEPTAVLLKKECFARVGWFDTQLRQILDYVFWYRVMRECRIGFVDAELMTFRLHSEQATQKNTAQSGIMDYAVRKRLYWEQFGDLLHPSVRRELKQEVTWYGRAVVSLKRSLARMLWRSR